MAPLAHAADWIESILLLIPAVGFIGWLAITTLRDRRRRGGGDAPDEV